MESSRVFQVAALFLRLGLSAFGGPAAHVALIERECVHRRGWMAPQQFLDVLGVSSLIPGPTSTELAMHVGRHRAGWGGLVVAGLAFITPAAVMMGLLAFVYVRSQELAPTRILLQAVQPVVVVMVVQAVVPLARAAVRSGRLAVLGAAAAAAVLAGAPEIHVLLVAGVVELAVATARSRATAVRVIACAAVTVPVAVLGASAATAAPGIADICSYFLRVGSLLFGSGYTLLPVLQGELVDARGWLTDRQLLDAVAAGQATPGPLFTTATFIGYVLGGPYTAAAATAAMFLPAFVFAALSSVALDRLRGSAAARRFLDGVNAAAVALVAVVVIELGRVAFDGPVALGIGAAAALAIFAAGVSATRVLLAAALGAALYGTALMR